MSRIKTPIDIASYKMLLEGIKDTAIFILSPEGYILSWNKGAQQVKGYSDQEIIGKHISVFYSQEDIEKGIPERNLQQATAKGAGGG